MKNKLYELYLKSPEWKIKSDSCKKLADNKCSKCNSIKNLQAHHLTYERVGEELQEDLQCLCLKCHEKEHGKHFSRKSTPNYYRVGNGTMNKHNIKSVDLLNEVMSMTKAEQLVISTIKDLIPWDSQTGEVYVQLSKILSKTNTVVFHKGYKLLKNKNLVRRTKQSHYMINPAALIPLDFDKAQILWNNSKNI